MLPWPSPTFGIHPNPKDTQPIGVPNVQTCTILHTAAVTGESEGPNSSTVENWHSLQDPCGNCTKVCIGQTSRIVKHHHTNHKMALRLGEAAQSAVAQHMMEDAQTIHWEDVEVVNHNLQYFPRCTLKACHIQTKQHKMTALFRQLYNAVIHLSHLHASYWSLTIPLHVFGPTMSTHNSNLWFNWYFVSYSWK